MRMTFRAWAAVVLVLGAAAAPAQGQPIWFNGPAGFGPAGPTTVAGFSYSRKGVRFGVGVVSPRPYGLSPALPFYSPYYSSRSSSLTIVTVASPPPPPPQVIVIQVPPSGRESAPPPPPVEEDDLPPVPPAPPVRRVRPPVPPVRPDEKKPEEKKVAPAKAKPKAKPGPKREAALDRAEEDEAPADVEHGRLVAEGMSAFEAKAYGLAAQRFRAATRLLPAEARPYFLLGQALLAQAKYHDAHGALLAGLRRKPDWPTERFRPMELYGDNRGDHAAHLDELAAALKRHPRDPVLLFLRGYQLWFDGQQAKAAEAFRDALPRSGDAAKAIERFLLALPGDEEV